jgi:hypothetical protein
MRIENVPFMTTDWAALPVVEVAGERGVARTRTIEVGSLRLRKIEYSPGFRADHWCSRGHVILVEVGALTTELKDGRLFETPAGTIFQVAEDDGWHLVSTAVGASVFVVD